MIIYNVTIKVNPEVAEAWLAWMKQEHLDEMMGTGLFTDYRLARLMEQEEGDGITYVVQYHCDSLEHYESYLKEHADKMRQKGLDKFGNRFVAFRSMMELIH